MCLIAVALDAHPRWPLVLAGNRDEFHARASAPFGPWPTMPEIHGGRDLVAGGSWLALRGPRVAAVTNVRRMQPAPPNAASRGWLVRDYLTGAPDPKGYLRHLADNANAYAGFNLLLGNAGTFWFASNRPHWTATRLDAGIHVVANASLNTPWPKSQRLRAALSAWCATGADGIGPLLAALADETIVADADLPETGLPLAHERLLAPAFIRSKDYGTRASTVILGDRNGHWFVHEQRYGAGGVPDGCSQLDGHARRPEPADHV